MSHWQWLTDSVTLITSRASCDAKNNVYSKDLKNQQHQSNDRNISQNLRFAHVWSQFFPSICRDIFWLGGYSQNTLVMGVICSFWRMMKLIWWQTIKNWYFCLMLSMTRMKFSIFRSFSVNRWHYHLGCLKYYKNYVDNDENERKSNG